MGETLITSAQQQRISELGTLVYVKYLYLLGGGGNRLPPMLLAFIWQIGQAVKSLVS